MAKKTTTKAAVKFNEDDIDGDVLLHLKTQGATGAYVTKEQAEILKHFEFATVDLTKFNADGEVAAWITAAGVTYFDENYNTNEDDTKSEGPGGVAEKIATEVLGGEFTIRTDIVIPASKRGFSERGNKYPFDKLPVGGSFHIKATAERPKPSNTFGSTVSSANKRYNKDGKHFIVRAVGPDDPDGQGARVFRQK